MEDQGYPRIEKAPRQLRVFFQNDADKEFLNKNHKSLNFPVYITDSPHHSALLIDSDEKYWYFIDNKNLLERSSLNFHKNLNNLLSFLNLYYQPIVKEQKLDKIKTLIHKRKENILNLEQKTLKKIKRNKQVVDHKSFEEHVEMKTLISSVSSIELLVTEILNLTPFQHHLSCQILIHGRGNIQAINYFTNRSGRTRKDELPVKNFNSIFNLISKSKNKFFDQSQILKKDLGVIGTFLAKEIELKTYRILFIISRDGFLPSTKEEQSYFNRISLNLSSTLDFLLLKKEASEREQNLKNALQAFPIPIAIINRQEQIIFSSISFHEKYPHGVDTTEILFETFPLKSGNKLIFQKQDNDGITSDIHHFQRISLLGELLNTLQHELSNPLFGLKLTADLMQTETADDEINETLQDILDNASRCQEIIENFSYLYQDEKAFRSINLGKLIEEIWTLSKSETRGINKVISYIDLDKESTMIDTNPTWLTQIIFNLLVNSAQAIRTTNTPLQQHKILIQLKKDSPENINILISDTGPGISTDMIEKVFTPFYTTKSQGTGLGLSICRNLALKLGGKLSIIPHDTSPGTTFSLKLPLSV